MIGKYLHRFYYYYDASCSQYEKLTMKSEMFKNDWTEEPGFFSPLHVKFKTSPLIRAHGVNHNLQHEAPETKNCVYSDVDRKSLMESLKSGKCHHSVMLLTQSSGPL